MLAISPATEKARSATPELVRQNGESSNVQVRVIAGAHRQGYHHCARRVRGRRDAALRVDVIGTTRVARGHDVFRSRASGEGGRVVTCRGAQRRSEHRERECWETGHWRSAFAADSHFANDYQYHFARGCQGGIRTTSMDDEQRRGVGVGRHKNNGRHRAMGHRIDAGCISNRGPAQRLAQTDTRTAWAAFGSGLSRHADNAAGSRANGVDTTFFRVVKKLTFVILCACSPPGSSGLRPSGCHAFVACTAHTALLPS